MLLPIDDQEKTECNVACKIYGNINGTWILLHKGSLYPNVISGVHGRENVYMNYINVGNYILDNVAFYI